MLPGAMPIYEYRRADGTTFELLQKFTDEALTVDPETGEPVQRVFHAPAIHFKGKGFHNTDYGTRRRNRELEKSGESGATTTRTSSREAREGPRRAPRRADAARRLLSSRRPAGARPRPTSPRPRRTRAASSAIPRRSARPRPRRAVRPTVSPARRGSFVSPVGRRIRAAGSRGGGQARESRAASGRPCPSAATSARPRDDGRRTNAPGDTRRAFIAAKSFCWRRRGSGPTPAGCRGSCASARARAPACRRCGSSRSSGAACSRRCESRR
jgi:putative FmdB family regulatory protein